MYFVTNTVMVCLTYWFAPPMLAGWLVCLLAYLLTCLLACMLAYLLACWLAHLLTCQITRSNNRITKPMNNISSSSLYMSEQYKNRLILFCYAKNPIF